MSSIHPYRERLQREVVKTKVITRWRLPYDKKDRAVFWFFLFMSPFVYLEDFILGGCTGSCFVNGYYIFGMLISILTVGYAVLSFILTLFIKELLTQDKYNKEYYVME